MKKIALLFAGLLMAGMVNAQKEQDGIIRLDAWSVMYAGVDNPITVMAQNYQQKDLTVSIVDGKGTITPGMAPGKFNVRPSGKSKNLTLAIETKDKKGKTLRVGEQKIFVRDIPNPILRLGGYEDGNKINRKNLTPGMAIVPLMSPDFMLKIDHNSMKVVKMIFSIGAKEEIATSPRLTETMVSIINKAHNGDKMVIMAEVMMPDGKTRMVFTHFTLTGGPQQKTVEPALNKDGKPIVDEKGNPLYREVPEEEWDEREIDEEEE